MRRHVPDAELTAELIPAPDAPWREIAEFGHRFHAYKVAGSLDRVARITVESHDAWLRTRTLPDDVTRLRLCLFHTVRAVGLEAEPDPETESWARALVAAIAQVHGGGAEKGRR